MGSYLLLLIPGVASRGMDRAVPFPGLLQGYIERPWETGGKAVDKTISL